MSHRNASLLLAAALAMGCGAAPRTTAGSDSGSDSGSGSAADAGNPAPDGGLSLSWWTTCGDPVGSTADAGHRASGLPACTTETEGAACGVANSECDPQMPSNIYLLCSNADPKAHGCPISRAKFKKDIRYLADNDLQRVRDQLVSLPLATWRYKDAAAGSRLHLGFMIDGHESLACVEPERDQVDLYGYTSMAVATLQVQARQIEELQKEMSALRAELAASRIGTH